MNIKEAEIKTVEFLNRYSGTKLDRFVVSTTSVFFLSIFWTLLLVFLLYFFPAKRVEILLQVAVVSILHFSFTVGFLKYVVTQKKRPYIAHPASIRGIGRPFSNSSFPSSHMSSTVAMLVLVSYYIPLFFYFALPVALYMGLSRIYSGMHYPSDVAVGGLLGFSYGILAIIII